VGGVTQARLYGGDWISAIRSGVIDAAMAYFNPFDVGGTLNTITGGVQKLTTDFIGSVWSAAQYAAGSYVHSLATNYVIRPIAQALGISVRALNLGLMGLSQLGNYLAGDRLNLSRDRKGYFTDIVGIGNRKDGLGRASYFFDAVDVALSFQGYLTASSRQAVLQGGTNQFLSGHSEGAADITNLARRGLIRGGVAEALPFPLIAPGNVTVIAGSGDLVNFGFLAKLTNPDAFMMNVPFGHHSQGCYHGQSSQCTAIWQGW